MADINWKGLAKEAAKEVESLRKKLADSEKARKAAEDSHDAIMATRQEWMVRTEAAESKTEALAARVGDFKGATELAKCVIGSLMWADGTCLECGVTEHTTDCRISRDAKKIDEVLDAKDNAEEVLQKHNARVEADERERWSNAFLRLHAFLSKHNKLRPGLHQAIIDLRHGPLLDGYATEAANAIKSDKRRVN